MISDTEKQIVVGLNEEDVDHDEEPIKGLFNKYKGAKAIWYFDTYASISLQSRL